MEDVSVSLGRMLICCALTDPHVDAVHYGRPLHFSPGHQGAQEAERPRPSPLCSRRREILSIALPKICAIIMPWPSFSKLPCVSTFSKYVLLNSTLQKLYASHNHLKHKFVMSQRALSLTPVGVGSASSLPSNIMEGHNISSCKSGSFEQSLKSEVDQAISRGSGEDFLLSSILCNIDGDGEKSEKKEHRTCILGGQDQK